MRCRHCDAPLDSVFVDLGSAPPSNSYLTKEKLARAEKWYPLRVLVCGDCHLVQTEDYVAEDEMFSEDYAYFSSFSETWLEHASNYVEEVVDRFGLSSESNVVEVAANDGYLLQYVVKKGIPCYGVEPTKSTAAAAKEKGVDIVEEFFGTKVAKRLKEENRCADLIAANNVLAHVPDINDFLCGFEILLKEEGVATFEFPHLLNLVELVQFDTIYHEHYSYLSIVALEKVFKTAGLRVFDIQKLSTHGGSLRVFSCKLENQKQPTLPIVEETKKREIAAGLTSRDIGLGFQRKVDMIKNDLLSFLIRCIGEGKRVAAYGAAAKGNTFLNYAGVRSDLIKYVVDRNPAKQGSWLPGSRIPIVDEGVLKQDPPDYLLILPWNLRDEITAQVVDYRNSGGQCVVAVPQLEIF